MRYFNKIYESNLEHIELEFTVMLLFYSTSSYVLLEISERLGTFHKWYALYKKRVILLYLLENVHTIPHMRLLSIHKICSQMFGYSRLWWFKYWISNTWALSTSLYQLIIKCVILRAGCVTGSSLQMITGTGPATRPEQAPTTPGLTRITQHTQTKVILHVYHTTYFLVEQSSLHEYQEHRL